MTDLLAQYEIDAEAAINGDWIEGLEGFGDFAVRIGSLDAPKALEFQRSLAKQIVGRRRTRHDADLPAEVLDIIQALTLIECCVFDWRSWEHKGAPYPYSKENLAAMLLDDAPDGLIETVQGPSFRAPVFKDKPYISGKRFKFASRELMNFVFIRASDKVKALAGEAAAEEKKPSSTGRAGKPALAQSTGKAPTPQADEASA